jgi:hypothetical protein
MFHVSYQFVTYLLTLSRTSKKFHIHCLDFADVSLCNNPYFGFKWNELIMKMYHLQICLKMCTFYLFTNIPTAQPTQ